MPTALEIYGIKQCDTCRKALKWLDGQGIHYQWTDLRQAPVEASKLDQWWQALGPAMVNRRSTTWRQLDAERQRLDDDRAAVALVAEYPTLIKRPLVQWADGITVGFDESGWRERLSV